MKCSKKSRNQGITMIKQTDKYSMKQRQIAFVSLNFELRSK